MFIVLLRFSDNKDAARRSAGGHGEWIQQGFDDGVFALVGNLRPASGGAILAVNTTRHDLEVRVAADPFVAHGVVSAEILELAPSKVDPRLDFLR